MEKQYKQRVSQQHPVLRSPACSSLFRVSSVTACLPASLLTVQVKPNHIKLTSWG